MARGPSHRMGAGAVLALALTASGTTAVATGSANALPADCGVHLYPSLDPTGAHLGGEILDLTEDGIYVGSAEDPSGADQATYWIGGIAHQVPVDLEDGDLLDVTENHLAVGAGFDAELDQWRGYVFDLDTGEVTWLPAIGGDWASARRINEHGVAVGDGGAANGTGHPLRWQPPYTSAERLPKLGGSAWRTGAWAAGNNDHGDIVGSTLRGRLTPDRRDYGGVDARFHLPVTHAVAWTPQPERLEGGGSDVARLRRQQRRSRGRVRRHRRAADAPCPPTGRWTTDGCTSWARPCPGTDRGTAFGVSEERLGRRGHRHVRLRRGGRLPCVRVDRYR